MSKKCFTNERKCPTNKQNKYFFFVLHGTVNSSKYIYPVALTPPNNNIKVTKLVAICQLFDILLQKFYWTYLKISFCTIQ